MTATTSIHGLCGEKPIVFEEKINLNRHKAQVGFYVHAKSKLDESISSLEDSVKDTYAMPFDKVGRDLARERRIYRPEEQRSSFGKAIKSQRKQQEKINGTKKDFL